MTRPQEQSERFLSQLGEEVRAVISPILRIEPTDAEIELETYSALVLTSRNGLAGIQKPSTQMRCFAVGDSTAEAAAALGFEAISAGGTADDLVERVKQERPTGKLLFLRGEHTRGDVAERLRAAGFLIDEFVTYRQKAIPLSGEAMRAIELEDTVVLPVFSPRSAALLSQALAKGNTNAQLIVIAMSDAVKAAWSEDVTARVLVITSPTGDAMLRAVSAALNGTS